jgi:hypothetical protein
MAMSALPFAQAIDADCRPHQECNRQGWPLLPTMLSLSDIMSEIATKAVEREYWE